MCVLLAAGVAAGEPVAYGDPLSDAEPVRIGELVSNPERFVDKQIKVEGLVDDVCPMKGCWVDILDAQSRETIRFKVQDDVIVFPVEARGSEVIAEGVLRKHELSKQRAIAWMRHLAEERGGRRSTSPRSPVRSTFTRSKVWVR